MDAYSEAWSSCYHYCDKALRILYNHLQLGDAGSPPGGVAVEGRVREWGKLCHYVLFEAAIAIGGYDQQMQSNFVCLGSNMVQVKVRGETAEPTPVQLYLAAGESDQSATSGHIFMLHLRNILHGLPEDVPIMVCEDFHATVLQQTLLQPNADDLSQKQFPAGVELLIWPGEHMSQAIFSVNSSFVLCHWHVDVHVLVFLAHDSCTLVLDRAE